ncbi:MAG: S9 family peptidase [bacterium]|nr:S9 family peptidase [bacterium]
MKARPEPELKVRPEQIAEIRQPSDPNQHPDTAQIAFVVAQMDLEADHYVSGIWRWDGTAAAPFTAGTADKAPRWSPDGSMLAFLRAPEPGGKYQVAVMPTTGGEPTTITDFALGVSEVAWSPDGKHLAIVAREWLPDLADLDDDERSRRARRITKLPFRGDNVGWIHDRRNHVWLLDPAGESDPRCLTSGDNNETGIAWSPDSTEIAFLSPRHPDFGLESGTQVFTVGLSGGEATERADVGMWDDLSFGPSGHLYAVGSPDRWGYPDVMRLYRLDSDGAVLLTADFDRNLSVPAPATAPSGPQWLEDGTARILVEDRGRVTVNELTAAGEVTELVAGRQVITGVSFTPDGAAAGYVVSTTQNPGELWRWADGEATQLTNLNGALAASMVAPTSFTIAHEGVEIEGWIYMPPGDDKVPVILNIHGGPATQFGWGFFDEFQVYVGAGYGVVATNPRGSSGYGKEHVQAVVGQWQTETPPDQRDVMAAVDTAAAAEPRLDVDNVGVMGGSYGGLMTVRLIAADQRYKSAVTERGLYVFNSFSGTSDIGPWFTRMYVDDGALDSASLMWDASSLKGFSSITTPTLVVHSETDFRCPVEQAEQLFAALLHNGTTTEFLRFPAPESHELSRSGKPKHRVERFEAILEWHGRYL